MLVEHVVQHEQRLNSPLTLGACVLHATLKLMTRLSVQPKSKHDKVFQTI